MSEKKKWQNPELIVLVRSKPEEAVLGACKSGGMQGDATNQADACQQGTGMCDTCDLLAAS